MICNPKKPETIYSRGFFFVVVFLVDILLFLKNETFFYHVYYSATVILYTIFTKTKIFKYECVSTDLPHESIVTIIRVVEDFQKTNSVYRTCLLLLINIIVCYLND